MARHRAFLLPVVTAAALLLAVACAGDETTAPPTTAPSLTGTTEAIQDEPPNPVHVTSDGFDPETVHIAVGESVTWINVDDEPHWVGGDERGTIDSATLMPGNSYSYVFEEPGTYTYFNPFYEHRRGTVEVG